MSESHTMFNGRDQKCAAEQLMLSTDPSYDNRTIASTLKMQIRTAQHFTAQLNASDDPSDSYGYGLWCGFNVTSHLWSRLENQHQSVSGCAEECGDPLVQSGGQWQNLAVAAGLGTLYPSLTALPQPESTGLLRLVIHWEHHQHDLPQHQSQLDRCHLPSICQAPASICGKSMLPVPDPYQGGDWGWRRLHWIDVSTTT